MTDWSNDLILEFVQLYEKNSVLWNPSELGHKNRRCLNEAWSNISKELSVKIPVVTLKKKKESLMSIYRSLRKKISDSQLAGTDDVYTPSWFAYNAIDRFIRLVRNKKKSYSSDEDYDEKITEKEISSQSEEEELSETEEERRTKNFIVRRKCQDTNNEKQDIKNVLVSPNRTRKRKRTTNQMEDSNIVTKSSHDDLQTLPIDTQDGLALYGQILANKLKKLSARNCLILQNKIDNLVFQAELKQMDTLSEMNVPNTYNTLPNNALLDPLSPPEIYISRGPSPIPSNIYQPSPIPSNTYEPSLSHTYIQQPSSSCSCGH